MRRRSRGSNGRWFPTAQLDQGFAQTASTGAASSLTFNPIIADGLDEPANEQNLVSAPGLLGAVLTTSYLIKRIVGSVFVGTALNTSTAPTGFGVKVAAAIFVAQVDNDGQLLNTAAWDPFDDDAAQKPWMWRRAWHLGAQDSGPNYYQWPLTNAEYGSLREATHVDVKSKRVVGYENRLFIVYASRSLENVASEVMWSSQLRLFGKMVQKQ